MVVASCAAMPACRDWSIEHPTRLPLHEKMLQATSAGAGYVPIAERRSEDRRPTRRRQRRYQQRGPQTMVSPRNRVRASRSACTSPTAMGSTTTFGQKCSSRNPAGHRCSTTAPTAHVTLFRPRITKCSAKGMASSPACSGGAGVAVAGRAGGRLYSGSTGHPADWTSSTKSSSRAGAPASIQLVVVGWRASSMRRRMHESGGGSGV